MNKINVSNLKTYRNQFVEEKENFMNSSYNVFSSSYISTCSNSYVSNMKGRLTTLYNFIKYAYINIDNWWGDYLEEVEALENALSSDNSASFISDASLRNFVNNHLGELIDYNEKKSVGNITIIPSVFNDNVNFYDENGQEIVFASQDGEELLNLGEEVIRSTPEWQSKNTNTKFAATVVNGFTSIGEGIVKIPENIMDATVMDYVHDTVSITNYRYLRKEDGTIDLDNPILVLDDRQQNLVDFVKKEHVKGAFDNFYATNEFGQNVYSNSLAPDTVRTIGNEIGYYTGIAATGAITGPAPVALAMSAGMGKYQESALNDGADVESAYNYAVGRATWDAVEIAIGQKINKLDLFDTNLLKKYNYISSAKQQALNTGAHVALDAADAATATYVEPLLQMQYTPNEDKMSIIMSYYDVNNPLSSHYGKTWDDLTFEEQYKAMYEYNGGTKALLSNVAIGSGVSFLTEVPDVIKAFKNTNVANSIDDINSKIDVSSKQIEDSINSKQVGSQKTDNIIKNETQIEEDNLHSLSTKNQEINNVFDTIKDSKLSDEIVEKASKLKLSTTETLDHDLKEFVDSLSGKELKEVLDSTEGLKIKEYLDKHNVQYDLESKLVSDNLYMTKSEFDLKVEEYNKTIANINEKISNGTDPSNKVLNIMQQYAEGLKKEIDNVQVRDLNDLSIQFNHNLTDIELEKMNNFIDNTNISISTKTLNDVKEYNVKEIVDIFKSDDPYKLIGSMLDDRIEYGLATKELLDMISENHYDLGLNNEQLLKMKNFADTYGNKDIADVINNKLNVRIESPAIGIDEFHGTYKMNQQYVNSQKLIEIATNPKEFLELDVDSQEYKEIFGEINKFSYVLGLFENTEKMNKLFNLTDEQLKNIEVLSKNYQIPKYKEIRNWIDSDLSKLIEEKFGSLVDKEALTTLSSTVTILDKESFDKVCSYYHSENLEGFNNSRLDSVLSLDRSSEEMKEIIIHESLHKLTKGIKTEKNGGLNEALTEYFTKLTGVGKFASGYDVAVLQLHDILDLNITGIDENLLKTAYFGKNTDILKEAMVKVTDEDFYERFLQALNDSTQKQNHSQLEELVDELNKIKQNGFETIKNNNSKINTIPTINVEENIISDIDAITSSKKVVKAADVWKLDPEIADAIETLKKDIDLSIITKENMGEYLETYLGEFNLFVAFLDKVNECDIKNISSDFSSPLDFKKYILENLKETGKFNEISNSHLVYMTEVPELLVMLTGDSKYSTAVQKNLTTTGFNWLAPTYKNLTSEQFNAIFSDQIIKNGVEDLNLNYFTNLLKMFDESGEYKWMGCSTFTDKILDLSVDDFYDIPTKYIKNALENLSNNGDDTIALEFMKKLQDKFMTNEILSSNPKNFDKVISMFPIISSNEGVQKLKDSFVLMKRDFDTKIKDSIVKNSEIEIPNNLIYTDVESDKFYDLIYEVNGVEHRIELPANYGSYNLKSIIDENNLTDSAINGELKIKMLEYNHDKNKFILDELHGVRPGLNQIKILVDGKEQNLVLKCYGKTCSLKDSLGENVKNIEVISCQPIKSFNLEVDVSEVGKTYIFEYEIDGVMRSKYITAQGAHWSNGNKNVLDIDSLVLGNQLLDITNYRISKIDWDNFKHEKIDFVKSENVDIFTGEKYGGNQQDVTDIMKNFIENKCTTSIEYKKGELLMSLARKRFPNASELELLDIAKNYSTSGCSYMAFSNAFLTYMGRIDNYEAIFKDKFGFDLFLKDGNQTSYNVEALAFDIYLDYVSKKGDLSFLMNENGVSSGKFYEVYEEYFKTKGIDIDIHSESGESYKSIILNSEDEFLIMGSSMFDLEALEDNFNISNLDGATTNSQLDGKLVKGIGGHAMMVTEFDEDNNIIVSSWGKKYKYLPNSVKEYKNSGQDSYFTLHTVKFSFSE